jgi:AraC-like DNA-binding protein
MLSTSLPNIESFTKEMPRLEHNLVICASTRGKFDYPEHHTPYLFLYYHGNKGNYSLNGKRVGVSENSFYFLNPSDKLAIRFEESSPKQSVMILFTEKFVSKCVHVMKSDNELLMDSPDQSLSESVEFPPVPFEFSGAIRPGIRALFQQRLGEEELDSLLFDLLISCSILRGQVKQRMDRMSALKLSTREELYRRLFVAREFMDNMVCENLTLGQVAMAACLNKFHFLATFKELYGITPFQYTKEIKLKKAYDLLLDQQHTVTDVCYSLGFDSLGSFSNSFRKRFQVLPSQVAVKN